MIESTRNKIITIVVVVLLLMGGLVTIFIFTTNKPARTDDSAITKDHYYVGKGLEKYAKIIKPAIESYLKQDPSESKSDRRARLIKYFSDDSPVYNYGLDNVGPLVKSSSGKLTAVYDPESDSIELILYAVANIEAQYKDKSKNSLNINQTYWVKFKTDPDGGFTKIYDLGVDK